METRRALLLIADIGGYTQYMQVHRSMLGHAEAATARLLERVVDAAPGFELVEVEGDAAFLSRFLPPESDGPDGGGTIASVTDAAVAMHRAFHGERRMVERNLCPCVSCTSTSELTLKFVAHVGEVAVQKIRRRNKLIGLDVILVHRLLKNPVRLPEYVLLSEDLYASGEPSPVDLPVREIAHDVEGFGRVRTYVVEVQDLAGPLGPLLDPPWSRRIGQTFGILGRGLKAQLMRRPRR